MTSSKYTVLQIDMHKGGWISKSFPLWLPISQTMCQITILSFFYLKKRCLMFGTFFGEIGAKVKNLFEIKPHLSKNVCVMSDILCQIKSYGFQMKIFSRFTLWKLFLDFQIAHQISSEWTVLQYTSFESPKLQFFLLLWWIFQNLSKCVIICNKMNSSGPAFSQNILIMSIKIQRNVEMKMQHPNLFQPKNGNSSKNFTSWEIEKWRKSSLSSVNFKDWGILKFAWLLQEN